MIADFNNILNNGITVQGYQKVVKQQADNEQQVALELAPKAQVLKGRGIQGHFEIQSLRNVISRGFEEVFSTADAMLFHQNTRNRCFTILFDGAYFFVSSYGRWRLKQPAKDG